MITLQHSLLPALPKIDEVPLAARYLVGFDGNQVGGDWYDVLPLPDGDCLPGELRDDVALLMVGRAGPDNGGLPPLTDC